MWNTECLVQVKVTDICSNEARTSKANLKNMQKSTLQAATPKGQTEHLLIKDVQIGI